MIAEHPLLKLHRGQKICDPCRKAIGRLYGKDNTVMHRGVGPCAGGVGPSTSASCNRPGVDVECTTDTTIECTQPSEKATSEETTSEEEEAVMSLSEYEEEFSKHGELCALG